MLAVLGGENVGGRWVQGGRDSYLPSRPEVILMDINLPGINGMEALKILREDPITMHIPVIALSANALPRDIEKGLEAGFFRYLTKPILVREFMSTLAAALEHAGEVRREVALQADTPQTLRRVLHR